MSTGNDDVDVCENGTMSGERAPSFCSDAGQDAAESDLSDGPRCTFGITSFMLLSLRRDVLNGLETPSLPRWLFAESRWLSRRTPARGKKKGDRCACGEGRSDDSNDGDTFSSPSQPL